MQRKFHSQLTFVQNHSSYFIVFGALALGVFFRILSPGNVAFGFDQVQILEQANAILQGNFTLIGPRTGPANMFTGPLLYYLAAPLVALVGDPATVVFLPLILALFTGVTLFWIVRRYVGAKESVFALMIWAISPFLVSLDRVLWNPNLTILAATLLFFPLLPTKHQSGQKASKVDLLLLFVGAFLAYQAHFAGLLLLFLALISIFLVNQTKKYKIKQIVTITLGFLMSIGSLIIFDLRNDFLNTRGLLNLFSSSSESNLFSIVQDILKNIVILAETTGKLFIFGNSAVLLVTLGIFILICSIVFLKKSRGAHIAYLWLASIATAFAFYDGAKPEYYFLLAIPPILYLCISVLSLLSKQALVLVFTFFVATALLTNITQYSHAQGLTLGNQLKVRAYIASLPVAELIFDMPFGSELGLTYLLRNAELVETGERVHIAYPNQLTIRGITTISDIGVWSDPRSPDRNTVMTNRFMLSTPENVFLFQDVYPSTESAALSYRIFDNNQPTGSISFIESDANSYEWKQACQMLKADKLIGWQLVSPNVYLQYFAPYCAWLSLNAQSSVTAENIVIQ